MEKKVIRSSADIIRGLSSSAGRPVRPDAEPPCAACGRTVDSRSMMCGCNND